MTIEGLNKLNKGSYLVLLPDADYDIKDSVEFSFDNVIYLDFELNESDANKIIDFVNNKGSKLIIFDWSEAYRLILPYISKKREIKWVYKNNLAGLTTGGVRATFTRIMEFYDRNIVKEIACLDKSTSIVLKKAGYRSSHLLLDVKTKSRKSKSNNSIGLIGDDYNPNHNTYNQLSALKLVDYDYCKIVPNMPATKHFIDFFEIKAKEVNSTFDTLVDNDINLYCNFTFNNMELILKSLDLGIPCLLGNTDIFDDYPKLKQYLVLESDDDIGEIANKIKIIRKNKNTILKEYEKYRKEYTNESNKLINKFLR